MIRFHSADSTMAPHEHAESHVSFLLAGMLGESVGDHEEVGHAGSIAFVPADLCHQNRAPRLGALTALFEPPAYPDRFRRIGWRWLHGSSAARLTFALLSDFQADDSFGGVEEAVAVLLGAFDDVTGGDTAGPPPPWLRQIRDFLEANPLTRPSVFLFAQELDMHPVYLARRFRRAYGTSISGYTRHLRARAAADQLATTDESLTAIAHDLGFADQSHFCRIFKTEFGLTPGRYRTQLGKIRRIAETTAHDGRQASAL